MEIDAVNGKMRHRCHGFVHRFRIIHLNPKFILFEPRRDVGMGFCVNIGINSKRYRCNHTKFFGHIMEHRHFCKGFNIKAANARIERKLKIGF